MSRPIDLVLERLDGTRRSGDSGTQWTACCPAHDDAHQSLSIGVDKNGLVLLRCHTGCETPAVVAALGLTFADLRPEASRRDILPFRRTEPKKKAKAEPPKTPEQLDALLLRCEADPDCRRGVHRFASHLGLRAKDLWDLGCRWKRVQIYPRSNQDPGELWYPERDPKGSTTGICIRAWDGRKSQVPGSRRGLCYAPEVLNRPGTIYLPEGMTNTAALMAMGFCVVGRPSADGSADLLVELLRPFADGSREVVILCNNDQKKGIAQ